MRKNRLSDSPLEVTEFCLGTMTWGEQNSEAEGHAQIDWALANGINFIDTAEMYPVPPKKETQGRTETIVGTWLAKNKARRAGIVLASKIAGPGRREWIRNGETHVSKKTIPWAIDDSLRRLQTDYIDCTRFTGPSGTCRASAAGSTTRRRNARRHPSSSRWRGMAAAIQGRQDPRIRPLQRDRLRSVRVRARREGKPPACACVGAERLQPAREDVRRRSGRGKPPAQRARCWPTARSRWAS